MSRFPLCIPKLKVTWHQRCPPSTYCKHAIEVLRNAVRCVAYERIGLAIARGLAQQLLARLGCVDVLRPHCNGAHVGDAVLACDEESRALKMRPGYRISPSGSAMPHATSSSRSSARCSSAVSRVHEPVRLRDAFAKWPFFSSGAQSKTS